MTHTPLHTARGRHRFSQKIRPALRDRDDRDDIDRRGIANPHLEFPRRNPRSSRRHRYTGAGIRAATEIQSGGPGGEFGGSQRLYTGRNPFITPNDPGMDFGAPPRGQYTPGILDTPPISDDFRDFLNRRNLFSEATPMTPSMRGQGIANDATTMARDLTSGFTPEELEGYDPILGDWMTEKMMMQAQPPGGAVDMTGQYVPQPERPRWDNWFGDLIRSIGGRNRGGLASLYGR